MNGGAAERVRPGLAAVLLFLAGCDAGGHAVDGPPSTPLPPEAPPSRVVTDPGWERVFRVGGSGTDTLLFDVTRLDADTAGVTVVDRYGGRVVRFDRAGRVAWSFGRPGGGPGEFRQPRDLHVDGDGRSWILDVRNARLTVLGPDGVPAFLVPLDRLGFIPDRFLPLPGDEALLLDRRGERPFVRVDRRGRVLRRSPIPWRPLAQADPLAAQMLLEGAGAEGRWAAALAFGDRFFLFGGSDRLRVHGRFPESIVLPEVRHRRSGSLLGRRGISRKVVDPTFAALSLTSSPERLYVHFGGRTALAGRLLDSFALADGRYLESFRLPRPVDGVAWGGGLLYVSHADPVPTLEAWRPRAARLP